MKIQIKKLDPEAKIPDFALDGDAGMDLYSIEDEILKPGEKISCHTGIAMKIPRGYVGLVWDKSGISHKFSVKTLGGVFDSNYIGEWLIGLINLGKEDFVIKKGQKIAQVLFQKMEVPEIEEMSELKKTNREEKGFGNTDV
jgi:dUTP diphosphatase